MTAISAIGFILLLVVTAAVAGTVAITTQALITVRNDGAKTQTPSADVECHLLCRRFDDQCDLLSWSAAFSRPLAHNGAFLEEILYSRVFCLPRYLPRHRAKLNFQVRVNLNEITHCIKYTVVQVQLYQMTVLIQRL
jgi:hypothetical protein